MPRKFQKQKVAEKSKEVKRRDLDNGHPLSPIVRRVNDDGHDAQATVKTLDDSHNYPVYRRESKPRKSDEADRYITICLDLK